MDLAIVSVAFLSGYVSIAQRVSWNWVRAFGITTLLCVVTGAVGELPSLFFLLALPAVLWQHGLHLVLCTAATLPPLVVIALRILPRANNVIWTYLVLCTIFHALWESDWTGETWPTATETLRKRGIFWIVGGGTVVAVFGYTPDHIKVQPFGVGFLVFLGLFGAWWRHSLHRFCHTLGSKFV